MNIISIMGLFWIIYGIAGILAFQIIPNRYIRFTMILLALSIPSFVFSFHNGKNTSLCLKVRWTNKGSLRLTETIYSSPMKVRR